MAYRSLVMAYLRDVGLVRDRGMNGARSIGDRSKKACTGLGDSRGVWRHG
jgi:hypothetical protein